MPFSFDLSASKNTLGFGSADNALTFPHVAQELKITALSQENSAPVNIPMEI
jgi:hypothetical protein